MQHWKSEHTRLSYNDDISGKTIKYAKLTDDKASIVFTDQTFLVVDATPAGEYYAQLEYDATVSPVSALGMGLIDQDECERANEVASAAYEETVAYAEWQQYERLKAKYAKGADA